MAARYPHAPVVTTIQNPRHVSVTELERALEELTQQVAERKRQLSDNFRHIYQIVAQREVTLLAELDAIPAEIEAKIHEQKASLEELTQVKEETEKKLHTNRLNALLQKNINNIEEEMEKILSEQISFPHVSISCQIEEIERTLGEKCHILKIPNPYACRTLPIWHGVKKGEEEDQINYPTAICIDPNSQLIYVGEKSRNGRIQVFTSEGKFYSTIRDPLMHQCNCIQIHEEHIYLTSSCYCSVYKLNKKGKIIDVSMLTAQPCRISIEESIICIYFNHSLTVQIFDLNLKPTKKTVLKAISFKEDTTTLQDIILHEQQMFVLFSYWNKNNHPDPIQVFKLDGTLIRSIVTGNNLKCAWYFCLDSYENILVSDCMDHCIRIFSPDGILIQKIGREGREESGELWYPRGIAIDSKQRIIIVDGKAENILQAF